MFKYDKHIDEWSHEMIAGYDEIWGDKIGTADKTRRVLTIKYLEEYLNSFIDDYGHEIIKRFNKLTGLNYALNDIRFYTNTTPVSLHSTENFFTSISAYHQFLAYPTIIIHELSHIYICNFIRQTGFLSANKVLGINELLSPNEENEFKEITTVIINELFYDLLDQYDYGYPNHQEMRSILSKLWASKKVSFSDWISAAIRLIKKDSNMK